MSVVASCRPRFIRPLFLWALAAQGTQIAVELFVGTSPDPRLRFLMLLPLVPVAFFVAVLVGTIRKMDELEKRIILESIAAAFILTLVLTFALAGLHSAGLDYPSIRDEVGTFMLLFWASAYVFLTWRYR